MAWMKGKHGRNRNGYILSNMIRREDLGAVVSNYLSTSRRDYELKACNPQGDVSMARAQFERMVMLLMLVSRCGN